MSALVTKLNLEHVVRNSEPVDGVRNDRICFPSGAWRKAADMTVLTGASTPAVAVLTVSAVAAAQLVQWAANAAITVQAAVGFKMPADYAYTSHVAPDDLVFFSTMRRQRAAADAAAWKARLTVVWWTPGTDKAAYQTLATNPTAALPAIAGDNTASLDGFSELSFDLGARLRAEGKHIKPGDEVVFLMGPDSVNANAVMQMHGSWLRLSAHLGPRLRSLR